MSLSVLVVSLGLLIGASQLSEAAETEIKVIQPERDFAYTLGDVLVQQIVLPESKALPDLSVLNSAARVSDWLDRQEATLLQADGRQLLELQYQIVNVPESIRFAELPALRLMLSDGSTLKWQAWPFSLGPLSAVGALADSGQSRNPVSVKADDVLAPIDVQSSRQRLLQIAWVLGATVLSWCVWWAWRSSHDRHRLPFARAVHGLRQQHASTDPQTLEAWKIVHEAFNASAGQVVTRSDIGSLLERMPWLNALDAQVDAFFEESSSRFFSQPPRVKPFDLLGLAKRLASEEKRNAI